MWLVISDTHVGDRQANRNLPSLFKLLDSFSNKGYNIVLNGDIFDFSKYLGFDERHRTFLKKLYGFETVTYIEGNHDWFLSGLKDSIPNISFREDLLLYLNDNIIRITHGHHTDRLVANRPLLVRIMTKLNKEIYEMTGVDIQHIFSRSWLSQKILLKRQENILVRKETQANILIAGHTHMPRSRIIYDTWYYNCGDWINPDHRSYVLIDDIGEVELVRLKGR
jgi:UDP-2,3-diacylglucosamine pyrophosphatase LpxH